MTIREAVVRFEGEKYVGEPDPKILISLLGRKAHVYAGWAYFVDGVFPKLVKKRVLSFNGPLYEKLIKANLKYSRREIKILSTLMGDKVFVIDRAIFYVKGRIFKSIAHKEIART